MTAVETLTAEQRAVVEQPADALVLVTAGPGTGKTHTLVRRLEHLVTEHGVAAGEVLVLTFSRAAVRELRTRLTSNDGAARHIRARTFDSWALELLTAVDPEGRWRSGGFDDRIRAAAKAVVEGLADDFCDELVHVAVDEIQDLVGERRVMVEALLDRFACGITAVGDPAQAIYGFQVADARERRRETNRFFTRLRELFPGELVELALTVNFRVRDSAAEIALPFGRELRGDGEVTADVRTRVRGALLDTAPFGNLHDDFAATALSRFDITTAVLCRTNGQALVASEELHKAGVRHRLQRSAAERVVPAWIGELFAAGTGPVLTRTSFDELLPHLPLERGDDPERCWQWLVRASSRGGENRTVDLRRLRAALAIGALPDELCEQPTAPVTVSSYHRAKGLEFDRVIVADPGPPRVGADDDPGEEARMLYVAMTRARDDVMRVDNPADGRIRKDPVTDRWARFGWQRWQRLGIEVDGNDVSQEKPPGCDSSEADPAELRRYLLDVVHKADDVVLERMDDTVFGLKESPPYRVLHDGRPIAIMSERFRNDLHRFLRSAGREPRWPARITRVRIDTVETVVGSGADSAAAGLGAHGVWLVPRLTGLGLFMYGGSTQDEDH
ncbi:UvrD-helicase domain-containing protein [Amycolatopsis sp. NPDC058278]|uniref:UvrD-helicase domain-containing protein n=1 Tax=Amycolatopsis sp. NPDC058278 TaxID=3346417 RepID=UPI0036D9C759